MFGKWPAFDVTELKVSCFSPFHVVSLENGRLLMSRNWIRRVELDPVLSLENGRLLMSRNSLAIFRLSESLRLENGRLLMSRNRRCVLDIHFNMFGKWPAFDVTERLLTFQSFCQICLENGRLLMSRNIFMITPNSSVSGLENGRLLMSRNHFSQYPFPPSNMFGKWPAFDVTEQFIIISRKWL
ncbi:hypothetical protein MHK_009581 [Candidatus Magnetomorum sp. HK-1]|nr:hypothetical protein MHK_009581 [Candidatus Magnetomorum sp. HK-1]